jgi:hypothetical protein
MTIADIKVTKHRDGSVTLKGHKWDVASLVNLANYGVIEMQKVARRDATPHWLETLQRDEKVIEALHKTVKGES